MQVYLNGEFLPVERAHLSPLDRGFLYGDAVYEVIRCYAGVPFRLDAHVARLAYSLGEMRIAATASALREVPARLVALNGLGRGQALVYLQVSRGAPAVRQHGFPAPDVPPTAFGCAWPFTPRPEWSAPGLAVRLVPDQRWARCDIKTTALVPNVLAHQRAIEAGAQEALFVRDGVVLEGTLSSLFAVVDGEVRTAPLSNYILPSITRAAVLELCREAELPAREAPLFEHELGQAEELFVASTVHEVAAVQRVDDRVLPAERPVTTRLIAMFRALVEREVAAG
jgi:D-alanine transaminase